jgi:hypothetical protein
VKERSQKKIRVVRQARWSHNSMSSTNPSSRWDNHDEVMSPRYRFWLRSELAKKGPAAQKTVVVSPKSNSSADSSTGRISKSTGKHRSVRVHRCKSYKAGEVQANDENDASFFSVTNILESAVGAVESTVRASGEFIFGSDEKVHAAPSSKLNGTTIAGKSKRMKNRRNLKIHIPSEK